MSETGIDGMTIGEAKRRISEADELRKLMGGGFVETLLKGARRPDAPLSGRAVVVVDRGWIFAGDMSRTGDGYVRLDNALHVFRWESIGFAAVVKEGAKSSKVDLRPCDPVEIPEDAVVFRCPVPADWGKK